MNCLYLYLCILAVQSYPLEHLRYELPLSSRLHLNWDVDYVTDIVTFRLKASISQHQWLGFGFSERGEIENADVVVIWNDIGGIHHFQDAHTDNEGFITIDEQQDYTLENVLPSHKTLTLDIQRKIDTCDDEDYLIEADTTHVVFFICDGTPYSVEGFNASQCEPGMRRAQILKPELPKVTLPNDVQVVEITNKKARVPSDETTYWCAVRKLPRLDKKHHVVQFEAIITEGSENLVHHMEVFHCELPTNIDVMNYDQPCVDEEKPKQIQPCKKVIAAWAMGAEPLVLPEEAGYPIGGEDYSSYVMLEVHYNNVEHRSDIEDSSGIRLYITEHLRKYDAGTIEVGNEYSDKMALPPGLSKWNMIGYCISECTAVGVPPGGVQIFASQLHTHLTGRAIYTKHYRHGNELPELNRDNHYTTHFQEIRRLPKTVTLLPGDALVTVCEDSTLDRTNVTLGGFGIRDEMCVNYIHYFPLMPLEVCKSSVETKALYGFFGFMNKFSGQRTSPEKGISDNYHSINWTPINQHLLKTFYDHAPLSMQCNMSSGDRFPGNWEGMPVTDVKLPLPPAERPCRLK